MLGKDSLKQQEGMPAHMRLLLSDYDVLGIVLCLGGWSYHMGFILGRYETLNSITIVNNIKIVGCALPT